MFKFFKKNNNQSGMTFIEIVVVLGIFATLSATVLFNYRDFSNGVRLQNLAQEIALQGKRAQTLASQGRRPMLTDAQNTINPIPLDWVSSYGLAFRPDQNPNSFIFYFNKFDPEEEISANRELYFYDFVDGSYTPSCGSEAESECEDEIFINDSSVIDLICINSEPVGVNADPDCTSGTEMSELYVSFTRPFLEAYILTDDTVTPVANAFVRISSADGAQKRFVTFWNTGQISVN